MIEKIEAEAAEQAAAEERVVAAEEKVAAAAAATKFLTSKEAILGLSVGDVSVRTQKLRKWSSSGHRFGHRSELPFTFQSLRCVHFVHDIFYFWSTTFECFWRLHFVPISTCWMNVFKFKNLANMCIKSHRFLCNPYRS